MATLPGHAAFQRCPLSIALATAFLGISPSAGAASETVDARVLGEKVVTATRSEHDVRTAPASVTVVPRDEIEAHDPIDLLDAVRGTPGITLTGRSVGGRKTIALRGLEGKHVLNLIDGRRISASDDVVGHSDYQYGWLPMSAVGRIEVIRGPMSTLYGSEALGGVVNLITRQPKERWIGSIGLSGGDQRSGDGGDRTQASLFATGPLGDSLDLRLSGETQHVSAVPLKEDPRYSELEGRQANTAGLAARLKLSPGQVLEAGWIDGQEERWRSNVSGARVYEDRYDLKRSHGHLSWRGDFSGWRAQANAYRSELDITNSRTNGVAPTRPQNLREDVMDASATGRIGSHLLTAGGEWRQETLKNAGLAGGKDDATHKALFVQDELPIATHVAVTAGLRADNHEIFGTEYSPRAYLVWEATPALVVKGGYGHAFKAPTLKQISPNYVGAEGPHTFLGNAAVKPENSDSLEIGVDWKRGPVAARGVLFHTRVDDLITTRLVSVVGPRRTYIYDNVNKAEIDGLETGVTWDMTRSLAWSADLSLLKTKDKSTGQKLANRPEASLASRLDWQAGHGWSTRVGMEYTGKQVDTTGARLPVYTLWNASVAKQLGKTFNIRAGINNLADVRLAEKSANFGYAERGRTLYASLRMDF